MMQYFGYLRTTMFLWYYTTYIQIASVISKNKGNKVYYYIAESARIKGKTRIVSHVYLGGIDRLREMHSNHKVKSERFFVIEFSSSAAIYLILEEIGLKDSINRCVKGNG